MMKLKQITLKLSLIAAVAAGMASCGQETEKDSKRPTDTQFTGKINISVDESLRPLAEQELNAFHQYYKDARITPAYKGETEIFRDLLNDSVKFILAARELTPEEKGYFDKQKLTLFQTPVAHDAITLVVNNANKDTALTKEQYTGIFEGRITRWNQINPSFPNEPIQVVFDKSTSSTFRFITERFKVPTPYPSNFSAVKSNPEVVDYVEKNKNAIGIIGRAWIGDNNATDPRGPGMAMTKRIRVLRLQSIAKNAASDDFVGPFAYYMLDGSYPLVRKLFAISQESYNGLASSFRKHLASSEGQSIVHQMGLLPAFHFRKQMEIKTDLNDK